MPHLVARTRTGLGNLGAVLDQRRMVGSEMPSTRSAAARGRPVTQARKPGARHLPGLGSFLRARGDHCGHALEFRGVPIAGASGKSGTDPSGIYISLVSTFWRSGGSWLDLAFAQEATVQGISTAYCGLLVQSAAPVRIAFALPTRRTASARKGISCSSIRTSGNSVFRRVRAFTCGERGADPTMNVYSMPEITQR